MESINNHKIAKSFARCMTFRQAIRFEGLWNCCNNHQYDCQKCYKWWANQIMIEAFKRNQENHNKRTSV